MAKITHKGNKPVKVCYDEWISCLEDYKNSGKSLESWLEGVKDYSPTETYTGEEMRTAKNYYFLTIHLQFEYLHKQYEVLIPAKMPMDTECEWYGPLKLCNLYPYTINL